MQLAGGSGIDLLRSTDQFDVLLKQAIAQSVLDLQDDQFESLAAKIANAVARTFGGK